MHKKTFNKVSHLILGVITISSWSLLLWDHFHGGVPSHHLLANEELPKITNWWGAISIPLISYLLLGKIKIRIKSEDDIMPLRLIKKECFSFFAAMVYAIIIAVSFTTNHQQISSLFFLGLPVIALFFPVYQPSYLLGFLVGMTYTFGGVLPIIIAGVMSIVCYVLFIVLHPQLIKIGNKTGLKKLGITQRI
jgi:hypothetical protein